MLAQRLWRWATVIIGFRRDLLLYARRHIVYRGRARRDSSWLEAPLVVRLSPAVGPFSLEVLPRDTIGRSLYLYGVWDLRTTRLLQWFLRPGMTMLDIGANIGYFSLLAAAQVGPAGFVQSFEPHREIRDRLVRNVARNGMANIDVRAEAVTNVTGEVGFYLAADASNQGISSTVEGPAPHGDRGKQPLLVPAIRLAEPVKSDETAGW